MGHTPMGQFEGASIWKQSFPIHKLTLMAMSMFPKSDDASNDKFNPTNKNNEELKKCKSSLYSIIESDIIPRLLNYQNTDSFAFLDLPSSRALPSTTEIQEFAMMCAFDEEIASQEFINKMLKEGLSKENIFLDLITPAARYLGLQWELDGMDFYQVTHGLARLHTVTHSIGFSYMDGPTIQGDVKRIMIASAPGSEHLLGPTIVSEFFRKDGWQVVLEISPTAKELHHSVSNEWFDAIGLSVSIQSQLTNLSSLITQIKKSSRNPRVAILLGGPIFTLEEFKAEDFGAAGICADAKDAVELALSLLPND